LSVNLLQHGLKIGKHVCCFLNLAVFWGEVALWELSKQVEFQSSTHLQHLEVSNNQAPCLNCANTAGRTVANKCYSLAKPFGAQGIKGVFESTWDGVVVLRGNNNESVERVDRIRPFLDLIVVILLVRSTWNDRAFQQWNIKFLQVYKLVLNAGVATLSQVSNPACNAFAHTTFTDGT